MKYKVVITVSVIFFLIVNTSYFWEGKLGLLAMPAFLILLLIYLGLGIALIRHLIFAIRERFQNKLRMFIVILLLSVLSITFLKPHGLVDFDKLSGKDILIAQREGAANCMTTLKLKENNRFIERSVCFGISQIRGDFEILNDTIFFNNVTLPRHEKDYYDFAIIVPSKFRMISNNFDLVRYHDNDTTSHSLWITKNEINATN
jgi:hypothetical protein